MRPAAARGAPFVSAAGFGVAPVLAPLDFHPVTAGRAAIAAIHAGTSGAVVEGWLRAVFGSRPQNSMKRMTDFYRNAT